MKSTAKIEVAVGSTRRSKIETLSRAGVVVAAAVLWGGIGCHKTSAQDPAAFSYQSSQPNPGQADANGDPQNGNLAPVDTVNEAQQQADQYQQGAPVERRYPGADQQGYPPQAADANTYYDANPDQAATDEAQAVYEADLSDEQTTEPPPPLPDYEQPLAPDPDYIWTPGYWAWGPGGYYWVPGAWVEPPYFGALWTPGYWAFYDGRYGFHHGYWGLHIGFYGGINYGFGYTGYGYYGGYWRDNHFFYNRAVNRIDPRVITRVYDYRIREDRFAGRPSFNGPRGITVRPRPAELAVFRERRYAPLPAQLQLRQQSLQNRQQFYSQNHGRPAETVMARPIVSNHQMPAQLPQTAFRGRGQGSRQGSGGFQTVQPGVPVQQMQVQPNPQGRVMPQQGRQGGQVQGQPGSQVQQPNRGQYRQGQQNNPTQTQPQVQPQPQPQTPAGLGAWQRQHMPQSQPQVQEYRGGRPQQPAPAQATPPANPQAQPSQQQFRRGPEGSRLSPSYQPPPQQRQAQPQPQAPSGLGAWQRQRGMQPAQPQVQRPQPQQQFRRGPEGVRTSPAPAAQPHPSAQPHERGNERSRDDRGR